METEKLFASIPPDVMQVMERLNRGGFAVWLVGGVVRDRLLGRLPKDWDLATDATPQQVMQLFRRVIPVGIRHGTVQVRTDERGIELTSVPTRGKEGILKDLGRRDFTVNAIAVSFPEVELLDPHHGQEDLQNRILRAVGDPGARFTEDPLRTLRAGRFAGVYDLFIERKTFEALKDVSDALAAVAGERIREEMLKMLMGEHVIDAFEWMRRGGVIRAILPELLKCYKKKQEPFHLYDVYRHTILTVHHSPMRGRVRLAALFHDLAKPGMQKPPTDGSILFQDHSKASAALAGCVMERWKMSHQEIREVSILVENRLPSSQAEWSDASLRHLISKVGPELIEDLLDLAEADRASLVNAQKSLEELRVIRSRIMNQLEKQPPLGLKDLAIDGRDVLSALNLDPGPLVGEILRDLHRKVLDDPSLNERKILMDFLRKEYDKVGLRRLA